MKQLVPGSGSLCGQVGSFRWDEFPQKDKLSNRVTRVIQIATLPGARVRLPGSDRPEHANQVLQVEFYPDRWEAV